MTISSQSTTKLVRPIQLATIPNLSIAAIAVTHYAFSAIRRREDLNFGIIISRVACLPLFKTNIFHPSNYYTYNLQQPTCLHVVHSECVQARELSYNLQSGR